MIINDFSCLLHSVSLKMNLILFWVYAESSSSVDDGYLIQFIVMKNLLLLETFKFRQVFFRIYIIISYYYTEE